MTPQELKNSILQYAIQGKLVEQREEEGTGEELYQQIQTEKKKLIKEGKIKKEKPLPEITEDEIPFDIPESWKWVRLSTVGVTQTGNTPKKTHPEYFGTDIPFLGPGDIQNGSVDYGNQGLSNEGKLFGRITSANSILQVCIGGSIGKCALVDREVAFNQQINSIFPIIANHKYIFYILDSAYFKGYIKNNAGGTAAPIINRGIWDEIVIPLPPLAEQKRIVAKIEELIPYIDRYEEAWTELENFNNRFPEDMQKSLLQYAIQGKLVEQREEEGTGEELYQQIQAEKQKLIKEGKIRKEKVLPEITENEIPFDIPENWKWARIAEVASIINGDRGKNYPAKSMLLHEGIPFISALNLDGKTVIKDDNLLCMTEKQYEKLRSGKLIKGDIVVCIRGSLGKYGRYPFKQGAIASSLVIMRHFFGEEIFSDFLMAYIDSPLFFSEIRRYDNGTAQPNLAARSLEQFLIPLPPLAEQKRIVAKLEELLPLCEKLKQAVV